MRKVVVYALLCCFALMLPQSVYSASETGSFLGSRSPGTGVGEASITADGTTTARLVKEHLANLYDARNWGAKCDGRELSDVTTTAGDPTISSASYQFQASDVGAVVHINSSASGVIIATSTIASVNAGNAVLANGADVLFTGTNRRLVMYKTDDTAALTTASAAVKAKGGGKVYIPGVCAVTTVTQSRLTGFTGNGRYASMLYQIAGQTGPIVRSENFTTLTGTGANYGSNVNVPSFFGFEDIRLDGNRTRQVSENQCVDYYGNGQFWDRVLVQNCSGHGMWTEASGQYGYSQYDWKGAEEGWFNDIIVRNVGKHGWVHRGPHDSEISGYLAYSWAHNGTGYYALYNQVSGTTYNGSSHWDRLHAYASASNDLKNFYLAAGGDIRFMYVDFGVADVLSSNMRVNTTYILQCGLFGAAPCLNVQGNNNLFSQVNFSWQNGTTQTGMVGINIGAGFFGNIISGFTGSSTVSSAANNTLFKNRGNFGHYTMALENMSGAGNICADVGGSYNTYNLTGFGCNNFLAIDNINDADSISFHNKYNIASFLIDDQKTIAERTISANTTNASTTVSGITDIVANQVISVGSAITGTGIPANTYITAVGTNTLTLSKAATANGTAVSLNIPNAFGTSDRVEYTDTARRYSKFTPGSAALPSVLFGNTPFSAGLYGDSTKVGVSVFGQSISEFNTNGLTVSTGLIESGVATTTPGTVRLHTAGGNALTLAADPASDAYTLMFPRTAGASGNPWIADGTGAATHGTRTGNTTVFATSTGTRTSGNFVSWDANGNAIDSGVAVGGGGGGSGTVNSGTSGQIAYYAANGTAVSGQSTVPMTAGGNAASNATQGTANLLRDSTQHARWSAALNAFKSGTAGLTVAMIGDSLIDSVSGGTRLTSISNQLRNGLTHQGLMVNDNAWVGCGDDGNGGVRRDIADVRVVKGSSWGCDNTFLTMGGGTWFSTTNTNALAFSPDMAVDGALVYFVIQPSGGSFTIDFNGFGTQTINTATTTSGGGVQVVGLVGGNAIGVLTYSGGQGSNTTYNLKWSAGGRVDIIGIVATNSSGAAATLINAGVGGSVSAAAVNTTNPWSYLNVMTAIAPGLVVFDYAANDATLAVPTATYQSNLGTLLTAIQGWNGDAIAMTPPPKNPGSGQSYVFQETYNAIMRTQAATFGIPVADVFNLYESNYTKYQAAPYSLYSDTFVHQSAKGNATIADLLTRIMLSRSDMSKQMKRSVFQEVDSWGNYKLGGNIVIPKNVNGATSSTYFGVSGNANATGAYNAIIGYQAGNVLTTGFNHTAVGYQALLAMNTAQNNTAIGYQALKASTANDNTALGVLACGTVSTGTNNLCLGRGVGSTTLTTGGSNILIGTSSAITTPAAGTNNWLSIGDAIAGSMAAPALSACGTGPALATGGSDLRGTVTTGTGATACTITFATTKANAPTCIVTARSGTPPVYTTSTAALTLTTAAASAGYDYFCSGK